MDYTLHTYMQPHASHIVHPERLLMKDMQGAWYLWFGDGQDTIAVTDELAAFILDRPEMIRLRRGKFSAAGGVLIGSSLRTAP